MGVFGWKIFEIAATFCEQSIILYFICSFLKHDFKTLKGKLVYISGSVLDTVMVTALNSVTLYDWWLSVIYIAYWFVFSLFFIGGRALSKLLAAILANVVSICTSNIVTGVLSIALKSTPTQLYTTQGWYRVLGVLMCQTLNLLLYSLILKIVNKTKLKMKKEEWLLIISVFFDFHIVVCGYSNCLKRIEVERNNITNAAIMRNRFDCVKYNLFIHYDYA